MGERHPLFEFDHIAIDRRSIPQSALDITSRRRTSLFPWRGQFAPELVEVLLEKHATPDSIVADPFVGSGSTLFEAAAGSLVCYGADINPAAVEMARTVEFVNLEPTKRDEYLRRAQTVIEKHLPFEKGGSLFGPAEKSHSSKAELTRGHVRRMLLDAARSRLVHNILVNTILRYAAFHSGKGMAALVDAFRKHSKIIRQLPYHHHTCKVFHCDARALPLVSRSVDVVLTSPPYINVFNYHQNYRLAMELVGWDLLRIAKAEIGSNRKHRGNRFLTVIQYCIDMMQALVEIRRVLRRNGRAILVIGRESRVRGIRFENGRILATLAAGGSALRLDCRQERKFTNRFGDKIYEDILHFLPVNKLYQQRDDLARSVAVDALSEALACADKKDVRNDICEAIRLAADVSASPRFEPATASRAKAS